MSMAILVLYHQHCSPYCSHSPLLQGFPSSPGEHRNSLLRKCHTTVTIAYLLVNYFHVYQDLNCVLGNSIIDLLILFKFL